MDESTKPLDRLRIAAIILIVLGIIETIVFALAVKYGFSFGGGSIIYVYVGYRLLKRNPQTYKTVTRVLTAVLAVLMSVVWFLLLIAAYTTTSGIGMNLSLPVATTAAAIAYSGVVTTLSYLLFHPETRCDLSLEQAGLNPWILHLTKRRAIGVAVSGAIICGLILGPHIKSNPLRPIATAIQEDEQVQQSVGEISQMSLSSFRVFNWTVHAAITVYGSTNTGSYYAELSSKGDVRLDSYDFESMPDLVPSASEIPEVAEYQAPSSASDSAVVLLSTSFEQHGRDVINEIAPFVRHGDHAWARQTSPRSGQFAINTIPKGNPGVLSYFGESLNRALLSSTLDGTYEPFNVAPFQSVTLEFWRFSTSNPSETHNCLGSLRVDYLYDYDYADYLYQESARKRDFPDYDGIDYYAYQHPSWVRLLIDGHFYYSTFTSLATYILDEIKSVGDETIRQLIPHEFVDGKNHGRQEKGGYLWDVKIDAAGQEAQLDELKSRFLDYQNKRWLALSEASVRRAPAVYTRDEDWDDDPHRTYIFANGETLKQIRWRDFSTDCDSLMAESSVLEMLLAEEIDRSNTWITENHQDIQDDFDPTVVKLRRKRKIIMSATALDDLIGIGGDGDQSN